jgi:hypothetical protein
MTRSVSDFQERRGESGVWGEALDWNMRGTQGLQTEITAISRKLVM